jgi:hypothetical protein
MATKSGILLDLNPFSKIPSAIRQTVTEKLYEQFLRIWNDNHEKAKEETIVTPLLMNNHQIESGKKTLFLRVAQAKPTNSSLSL